MILKADKIAIELRDAANSADPLIITPKPESGELGESGAASIDIRLGCWFLVCREMRVRLLDVYDSSSSIPSETGLAKLHYVPFGKEFILHPKTFVLGVTLEWIRLPGNRAAYVIGKSSWGRHGLNISAATGVHPGFTGCLTLELSNLGEVPISIRPGTTICQLFIHQVDCESRELADQSSFIGRRQPTLGVIKLDPIAKKLAEGAL